MKTSLGVLVSMAAIAVVTACGGGQKEPETAAGQTGAPADGAAATGQGDEAAPTVWSDTLSDKQKSAFMKQRVMPVMGKVLAEMPEEEHHGEANCGTCHGQPFKLPKDFLPKLTMKGGELTAFKEHPKVAAFMHERVVPEMAKAMGMQPYDPATKQGFGCGGCHAIEMK